MLFGSSVVASLRAGGHEPVLVSSLDTPADDLAAADLLVVDLTYDATGRIEQVRDRCPPGLRTLAFYSHVETEVRSQAEQAGFDLVVPRSRMAREGAALVERLLTGG